MDHPDLHTELAKLDALKFLVTLLLVAALILVAYWPAQPFRPTAMRSAKQAEDALFSPRSGQTPAQSQEANTEVSSRQADEPISEPTNRSEIHNPSNSLATQSSTELQSKPETAVSDSSPSIPQKPSKIRDAARTESSEASALSQSSDSSVPTLSTTNSQRPSVLLSEHSNKPRTDPEVSTKSQPHLKPFTLDTSPQALELRRQIEQAKYANRPGRIRASELLHVAHRAARLGYIDEAIQAYQAAAALDPDNYIALEELAKLYLYAVGSREKAADAYAEAIERLLALRQRGRAKHLLFHLAHLDPERAAHYRNQLYSEPPKAPHRHGGVLD